MSSLGQDQVRSAAESGLKLFGDYSLGDPLFLGLIPVALLAVLWGRSRAGRVRGRVPGLPGKGLPRSLRQRLAWLPTLLQLAALLLVVVGLARPLRGNVHQTSRSEGVDIAVVIDRSGSMRYDDLERGKSRLDVVKEVVGEFAERRMTDREFAADSVGLFAFARFPQLICPFTLDVGALLGWLDGVEMVERREEDGTAIGIALAKAVAVLRESDAKSRVCVLLTDGENNVDEITPIEAATLAGEEGIRVYTIHAGKYQYRQNWDGSVVPVQQRIDTTELVKIAELTGGRFFRATNREQLEAIYAAIEELERTPREELRFEETFDLYPYFLEAALALYALAWLCLGTWARRLS